MNVRLIRDFPLKLTPLLAALSIATALAGCGSDTSASTAAGGANQAGSAASQPDSLGLDNVAATVLARKPCEYMARADAEAALGQALPNTSEHIPLGLCEYNTAEFQGASLTVGDWESIRDAATSGKQQPTTICDVGDEALNLNGSNLHVRKGAHGFLLSLNGPNVDDLPDHGFEREKTLALKILPNL